MGFVVWKVVVDIFGNVVYKKWLLDGEFDLFLGYFGFWVLVVNDWLLVWVIVGVVLCYCGEIGEILECFFDW